MRKQIAILLCVLLLAACTPQRQSSTAGTTAPADDTVQIPEQASSPSLPTPAESGAERPPAAQQESSASQTASTVAPPDDEETLLAPPRRVDAVLHIYYDGEKPRFSHHLRVPAEDSYAGDADTVTVERQNGSEWEPVRDSDTGNFTLDGKLTVNGPLPRRVLDDAVDGVLYRITTVLQTGSGGEITAVSTFRAGETFADDAADKVLAGGSVLQTTTQVETGAAGLLPFTQTIVNNSGQTVRLDGGYQVLRQNSGGLWTLAPYPDGEPAMAEGGPVLLPGQSVTESGLLPITAQQARKGGTYRILRQAVVCSPRAGQEAAIEFFSDLRAGERFEEAAAKENTGEVPTLQEASLVLEQTAFLAGEIPLAAWVANNGTAPIVAGKLRVYNVKDGENRLAGELDGRIEIAPGQSAQVLDVALTLEPGEYTAEASVRTASAEALVSRNFTVEAEKLKNAASGATVEMKITVDGQTDDGLAAFTQTFFNNSCQTLLIGRGVQVEEQTGGLWVRADYPEGLIPAEQEEMLLLRPGASASLEGALPFPAREMPKQYRITRTLMVENPLPSQKNGLTLVYTVTKK